MCILLIFMTILLFLGCEKNMIQITNLQIKNIAQYCPVKNSIKKKKRLKIYVLFKNNQPITYV